ncbi:MAG: NAD-dependent epimerase/dehydratase family protein [Deltaproteobacteria bacterium]|nr:MAG: NAD-dependent epimerase/dehydratase family protein [Deltaproteobacteria bacterium]
MKTLVTGGGGFLGRRIVELLLQQGHDVSFLSRGRYPEVEALGATWVQADLCDAGAVREAVRGMDVVFHVAAKAEPWGKYEDFYAVNVTGTDNVIAAMKAEGVKRLVYTSTPSVVSMMLDTENGAQDLPYSDEYPTVYAETKAEAERHVIAANGPELATVSLRPHLIMGPREDKMIPRILERAETGKLPQIGDGSNVVDITYVDNAAWAHLDAMDALEDHTSPCAGKAYFISNDEPVRLWDWVGGLLEGCNKPPLKRQLSYGMAWRLAGIVEFIWRLFGLQSEPRITQFQVAGMGKTHWYDMGPAKRDLGYRIRVPLDEGTKATIQWFTQGEAEAVTVEGEVVRYA